MTTTHVRKLDVKATALTKNTPRYKVEQLEFGSRSDFETSSGNIGESRDAGSLFAYFYVEVGPCDDRVSPAGQLKIVDFASQVQETRVNGIAGT